MDKDSKVIVGLTCFVVALLHSFLLLCAITARGESAGLVLYFLEWPLAQLASIIWQPGEIHPGPLFYASIWVCGTIIYVLIVGVPLGFAIVGIRRLIKGLNNDKWIHDD
jgi:hypothetical protein